MGRDGIETPTPGFSVRLGSLNRQLHSRSYVVIRRVTAPSPSAHNRWRRVVPNGMVQVWGKSPARVTRGSDALRYAPSGAPLSSNVLREQIVDQGLVTQPAPLRLPAHGSQYLGIDPNGDEASGRRPQGGTAHAAHGSELYGGRLGDIGEINPSPPHRPRAPSGSRAAR